MGDYRRNLLLVLSALVVPVCILQAILVYHTYVELRELDTVIAGSAISVQATNIRHVIVDTAVFSLVCALFVLFAGVIITRVLFEQTADRARAHSELAKSSARLKTLVDAIPEVVYFKDAAGRHLFDNKAYMDWIGLPAAQIVGKTDEELLPADLAAKCVQSDRAVAESRQALRFEESTVRPDGSTTHMETIKAPIFDGRGSVAGLVGVSRDITGQRRLEEQLRQSQKIEAVVRLAGGVAHGLNNYLGAITGYCDQLRMVHAADGGLVARVDAMSEIAFKASALVKELLAFSRKQPMRFEVLSLNDVVEGMAASVRKLVGPGIAVDLFLGEDVWNVKADRLQLEQVFTNLALNAREAMADSGSLTVETRNSTVEKGCADTHPIVAPGGYVVISVSDTGHGMTPEIQERIFEPFFSTRGSALGTGLGLSTVYGIVKQHGGYILVNSEPGKGSTFRVYLPRCQGVAAAGAVNDAPGPVQETAGMRAPTRILLVEDNADVKEAIRSLMETMGYAVVAAASGDEALTAFDRDPDGFSLLVTDVVMAGMCGDEVAARIRERNGRIKVLFISGYTDNAIVRNGALCDGVNFLQKPFSSTALRKKIEELLARKPAA